MAGAVKRLAIEAACSRPVAEVISRLTSNRIPNGGVRVDLGHPDVPPRIRAAAFWRLYERAEVSLIHEYLPSDLDVIELGSSFGVTGAHVLSVLDEDRRLFAVEANPFVLPALRQSLADRRAEVVHAAVAPGTEDTVSFHVQPDRSLHSRLNARSGSIAVEVPRTTMSELVNAHVKREYAFIADVEGAEAAIIREDADALRQCRLMIIELHSTTYNGERIERAELAADIARLGFARVVERRRTVVFRRV